MCTLIYYSVANTRTINDNGFNPTFGDDGEGETFEFVIQVSVIISRDCLRGQDFDSTIRLQDRESAMLRVVVKDSEKTKQDTFIGQLAMSVTCIRQVLLFILQKHASTSKPGCESAFRLRKLICVHYRDIDTYHCGTRTITWCSKLASFAGFAHVERIQFVLTLLHLESPDFRVSQRSDSESVLILLCVCTDSSLSHFHHVTEQQQKPRSEHSLSLFRDEVSLHHQEIKIVMNFLQHV